jgi:hypothetical protein
VIELAFLEDFVKGSEHGEIAAAGTPGGVIGGDGFLGELFSCGWDTRLYTGCCCFAHFEFAKSPNR